MTSQRARRTPGALVLRAVIIGAVCGFVTGGIIGLVVGLRVHPATAWAAVFEVGIPGTVAGVIGGLMVAGVRLLLRSIGDPRHGEP